MRVLSVFLASVLAMSFGCAKTVYRIDLKPVGDQVERRLTVEENPRSAEGYPSDELKRIELLYLNDQEDHDENVFVGRFRGKMPDDVGGAGSYTHFATSLGSASIYSERFGDSDDIVRTMSGHHAAIDDFVALLSGWVDYEIEDPAAAERIKTFLNGEVRTDIKNLSYYMWVASAAEDEKTAKAQFFRMAQYLMEREYFSIEQLPAISRIFEKGDQEPILELVRSVMIRRLELSDGGGAAPKSLAVLNDVPRVEASLRKFLRGTESYQKLVSKAKEEGKSITEDSPDPMQVISELAFHAAMPFLTGNRSNIEVKLHLPREPLATNGKWDGETQAVDWSRGFGGAAMPAYVFAVWTSADVEGQTSLFGRVVLDGEKLGNYVRWYHSLSELESPQWDEMLASLHLTSNNLETLREFQFANSPGLAEPIVSVLIQELEKSE